MSSLIIKDRIRDVLADRLVRADCDGEFRREANLTEFSNNAVQSALGSMIRDGEVTRHRSLLANRDTGERPVTWRLSQVSVSV